MKKLLSFILIAICSMALTVPAFADGNFEESTSQTDKSLTGNSPATAEIPVYGYIGQNADISDTDPSNPDAAPVATPNGTSISVTVPTKVIFAAFAENKGEISSPDYTVSNNSKTNSVTVSITSFTPETGEDNSAIDPNLDLKLKFMYDSEKEVPLLENGTALSAPVELTRCLENDQTDFSVYRNTASFKLTGNYSGTFADSRAPSYDMVIRFDLYQ